jgi:hypothetical protein
VRIGLSANHEPACPRRMRRHARTAAQHASTGRHARGLPGWAGLAHCRVAAVTVGTDEACLSTTRGTPPTGGAARVARAAAGDGERNGTRQLSRQRGLACRYDTAWCPASW